MLAIEEGGVARCFVTAEGSSILKNCNELIKSNLHFLVSIRKYLTLSAYFFNLLIHYASNTDVNTYV